MDFLLVERETNLYKSNPYFRSQMEYWDYQQHEPKCKEKPWRLDTVFPLKEHH